MNYRPSLQNVPPPPAPGTVEPFTAKLLVGKWGTTDPYGNITVDIRLPFKDGNMTIDHEMVHRFFAPKFGPFRHLRARVAMSGYNRSAMLRYLEEAIAECNAQIRAEGIRGIVAGLRFPLEGEKPYISVQQGAAIRGQFIGVIVVDGQVLTVTLDYGPAPAAPPQVDRHQHHPATAPAR
ncbi:hypothetical protein [Terriglobus sp.]|uniref:hypothetical protein n=1 Tax=Terriglobus sp. TaxID=1889013 RepID=UPI003B00D790